MAIEYVYETIPVDIDDVLLKLFFREEAKQGKKGKGKTSKYTRRILELHNNGKSPCEISKIITEECSETKISPPQVKATLERLSVKPNVNTNRQGRRAKEIKLMDKSLFTNIIIDSRGNGRTLFESFMYIKDGQVDFSDGDVVDIGNNEYQFKQIWSKAVKEYI